MNKLCELNCVESLGDSQLHIRFVVKPLNLTLHKMPPRRALAAAIFTVLSFLIPGFSAAQPVPQNIILDKAVEEYDFELPRKNGEDFKVVRRVKNIYRCRQFSDAYTFREAFFENSEISDVVVFVDDYRRNDIQPSFSTGVDKTVFQTQRICSVRLPFGSMGMKADIAFKQVYRDPRRVSIVNLADDLALKHKTVIVRVPDWLDMRITEWNFRGKNITHTVTRSGRDSVHTYTISDYAIPAELPNSPGILQFLPHLVFEFHTTSDGGQVSTYFSSTQDIYSHYRSQLDSTAGSDPDVAALAKEITKGLGDDREKVRAIYYWVQNNVRYIAFEDGIAGLKPDLASNIIRKKYGDCKSMSTLMVALMRSLGLQASHCWIGTNDRPYDYRLHSQIVDNHMIAAWMDHGKAVYLDATPGWMTFGGVPEGIQGRQVLRENGQTYALDHVPVQKSEGNLELEERTLRVENGQLRGTVKHTLKGQAKCDFLSFIHANGKSGYDEALRSYIRESAGGYDISNIKTSDLSTRDGDVWIGYDVVQATAINSFDNEHYLDPDNRKHAVSKLDTAIRRTAYVQRYKRNCRLEIAITLPSAPAKSVVPDSFSLRREDYGMDAGWALKGTTLHYHAGYWTENLTIPTSSFHQVNADFDELRSFYSRQPELHF